VGGVFDIILNKEQHVVLRVMLSTVTVEGNVDLLRCSRQVNVGYESGHVTTLN